jgi:hypothetical protein
MTTDLPKRVQVADLRPADIIDLGLTEGYGTATVESIDDEGTVTTLRPYVADAGFLTTSGVITYLGWEYVKLYQHSDREVTLLRRSTLK